MRDTANHLVDTEEKILPQGRSACVIKSLQHLTELCQGQRNEVSSSSTGEPRRKTAGPGLGIHEPVSLWIIVSPGQ
jgi:hypothetical protein